MDKESPKYDYSSCTVHYRGPTRFRLPPRREHSIGSGQEWNRAKILEFGSIARNGCSGAISGLTPSCLCLGTPMGNGPMLEPRRAVFQDANHQRWRGGGPTHSAPGSAINAIDCLPDPFVCVVVSQNQGIGVIDRDHRLSWIGELAGLGPTLSAGRWRPRLYRDLNG